MSATDTLDAPVPPRAVFHPVVDLGTGAVVAVEAHAAPAGGSGPAGGPVRPDPASGDVRRAVEAARAAAELRTPLPLQIGLRADTLASGADLLDGLHRGLGGTGPRPQEIILCVGGGFPPARRPALAAALSALRRAGLRPVPRTVPAIAALRAAAPRTSASTTTWSCWTRSDAASASSGWRT